MLSRDGSADSCSFGVAWKGFVSILKEQNIIDLDSRFEPKGNAAIAMDKFGFQQRASVCLSIHSSEF